DQILGKQIPHTKEGLWSINNQNHLLPDLLQQNQITDSSVNLPQVPLTCQEPQNKPLPKGPLRLNAFVRFDAFACLNAEIRLDVLRELYFNCASSAKPEPVRRENARKGSVVNVNPTHIHPQSDSPEIHKYKKKFNSEVLHAALGGTIGTLSWISCVTTVMVLDWDFCAGHRSKFIGGNREWIVAAGQKWARKNLYADYKETVPENGCSGRTQCANYYIRVALGQFIA
ncbi:hypothetical protein HGM15179_020617, partial [Zosterops borbonicus]